MLPMVLLMWAFMIRPQQRRDKEQQGDARAGGEGRLRSSRPAACTDGSRASTDDVLTVEIAPNVRVKLVAQRDRLAQLGKAEGEKS